MLIFLVKQVDKTGPLYVTIYSRLNIISSLYFLSYRGIIRQLISNIKYF